MRVGSWAFSRSLSLSLLLFASLSPADEDPVLRTGESIVNVTVELTGPAERLLVLPDDTDRPTYTYSAQGHYGIGGQAAEEFTELPIVENYIWEVNETIAEIVTGGQEGDKSVTIRFRSGQDGDTVVAVTYLVTPGSGQAEEHIDVVVPTWSVGTPIECGDISSPANGAVLPAGVEVPLTIPQPTDDDTRTGEVTETVADTCTVVWSAGAGTFKDDINTGLSVVWIAPADGGEHIPISATITDAGVVPPRERGSRLDSADASTASYSLPDSSSFCCTSVSASPAAGLAAVASGVSAGVVAVSSTTEGTGGGLVKTIDVNVAKIDGFLCDGDEYPANGAEDIALPLGYSDGGGLLGSLSLAALSSLRGTLGPGEEAWPDDEIQWTGVIANEDGTATLDTTVPGTYEITVTCGTSTASITIHIVEAAELECEGVVSATDNPDPLSAPNVPVGVPGTVTITATLNPDDAPLDPKYLVWSGNGVAGNGCTATLDTSVSGTYTVTLTCGTSVKRIKVNVVAISSLSTSVGGTATPDEPGSLVIPVYTGSDSIQIVATPTPAEASFPEDGLVWSGSVTGEGTSVHLSTMDSGIYTATATCGTSSATFNIRIVQVASVSCGSLVSTAAVPGADETLNVPVGANDGLLTFSAESTPGDWPNTYPDWLGVTDSIGDTATLSTESPGTFLVEACCGNRKRIIVNVIGIHSVKVRRQGSGDDYGTSAIIAAGALPNPSHTAELEITIDPVPDTPFSVTLPLVVANAQGYPGDDLDATLTVGETTLAGNGTATVTFTDANTEEGVIHGTLVSSNCMTPSPCTVGEASVEFSWDCSGEYDFRYPAYFMPGRADDVSVFLTLDEVGDKDEDGDGAVGEGAIQGHSITYYTPSLTVEYWKYNLVTGSYDLEPTVSTFFLPWGSAPADFPVVFGVTADQLIRHGAAEEGLVGQYTNLQTVYDYAALSEDGASIEGIMVLNYTIAFMDNSLRDNR